MRLAERRLLRLRVRALQHEHVGILVALMVHEHKQHHPDDHASEHRQRNKPRGKMTSVVIIVSATSVTPKLDEYITP